MPPRVRTPRRAVVFVVLGFGTAAAAGALRPYDPDPWLRDLAQLERSTGEVFANLDWHVARGAVDPVALHRRTDSLIRHAESARDAERALREFVAAFEDGHFRIARPGPAALRRLADLWRGRESAGPPLESGPPRVCAALGYENDADQGLLAGMPEAVRVNGAEAPFPAATVRLADGRTAGVLRIASFRTDAFKWVCESVWPRVRDSLAGAARCGPDCEEALWWAVSNALLADERRTVAALERAGANLLVVDLTGNGGGTDWADPAARQLTGRALRGQPSGFIRHAHYVERFADAVRELDSVLGLPGTTAADRELLARARSLADSARRLALRPCDRSRIWTAGPGVVSCLQLESGLLHVTGWLEYLPPETARAMPGGTQLFHPAAFDYVEGVWRGPVVLVADRRTASAAEQFMVLLRDSDAAVVYGSRTAGAGCGYTNGGVPVRLEHSGLEVLIPDCARLRRTGVNEVAGVTPDHAIDWGEGENARVRAARLLAALAR